MKRTMLYMTQCTTTKSGIYCDKTCEWFYIIQGEGIKIKGQDHLSWYKCAFFGPLKSENAKPVRPRNCIDSEENFLINYELHDIRYPD